MKYTNKMKTLAYALAVSMMVLPMAEATSSDPPTGRYARLTSGLVYLYDSVTHTAVLVNDELAPYQCGGGSSYDQDGSCGNCKYVPDGEDSWKLLSTQYTWGRCVNVDVGTAGNSTDPLVRIDVRVRDSPGVTWSYEVVSHYTSGASGGGPTRETLKDEDCGKQGVLGGDEVHYCAILPAAVPNTLPSLVANYCIEVLLYRSTSAGTATDSSILRCRGV